MFRTAAVAALGLSVLAGPLYAGSEDKAADAALDAGAGNQVSVNIDTLPADVMSEITTEVGVAAGAELPTTIEAPTGIAAEVCGVEAGELAQAETATCDATQTSQAFNQLIQRQIEAGAGAETEMQMETDTGTETQ